MVNNLDNEIQFYDKYEGYIKCKLCPHNCKLRKGKFGVCKVITIKESVGVAINYGEVT